MPSRAFWADFVENHWQRKPGIFKKLLPTPIATAEELFPVMRASFKRPQIEATSVYVDGRHLTAAENGAFAPSEADQDVNAYLARCAPSQEICMVIYKVQELFPDAWLRARDFLRELYGVIGMPLHADLELFFGRYSGTPRGPHRDEANNFSFVLQGRKTYLLWPEDYFARQGVPTGNLAGQSWPRDLREPGLLERFRKDAIVLEAEPGDVLFWPYTYWHMAVATPDEPTFVMHIDLFNRPRAAVLADVLSGLLKQLPGASERIDTWGPFPSSAARPVAPPTEVLGAFDMLRASLDPALVQALLADQWMRHVSGYGFDHLPPRDPRVLPSTLGEVRTDAHYPLAWQATDGQLHVWSNGHRLTVPQTESVLGFLGRVNSGDWVRVDLRERGPLETLVRELHAARALAWRAEA